MIKGSCLCGQCRYEARGELYDVLHCHCSNCRKLHGAAFATYGGVDLSAFHWICDAENITTYQSSLRVTRYFCSGCGSLLATKDKAELNTVYLSLGAIDSAIQTKPEYHQYVASKSVWHVIDDDLPQYAGDAAGLV